MNPHPKKLKLQAERDLSETTQAHQAEASQKATEFESPDDLIRFDREQTEPPPGVRARLSEADLESPQPRQAWWRRFLGKR